MKKKILLFITVILSLLFFENCSTTDELKVEATTCKILKYNKITSDIYELEFVYQNDRIIKRKHYGNILSSTTGQILIGLQSEDSIVYDQNNNVEKIINKKNKEYDIFFYEKNSKMPYKRENFRSVSGSTYVAKWIENIQYNSENKILQTVGNYDDEETEEYKITTLYTYDSNGNLSQVSTLSNNNTLEKIYTYSNYDSNKNPFKNNIPFVDFRNKSYSKNNYRAYISKSISKGVETIEDSWETNSYQYNEYGYPLFAVYECD